MNGVSSIEAVENVALVSFKKIPHKLTLMADIFGKFSDLGIVIDMISQTSPLGGNVSISFTCQDADVVSVLKIANDLSESNPQIHPMVSSSNCKLLLAGEEMREAHGVFARALACLSQTSADLLQVTTSETEISLLIPAAHLDDALTALSAEFKL